MDLNSYAMQSFSFNSNNKLNYEDQNLQIFL